MNLAVNPRKQNHRKQVGELARRARCANHLHSENPAIHPFLRDLRSILNMRLVVQTLGVNHLNHHLRLLRNDDRIWLQKTFLVVKSTISPSHLGITNGDQHAFAQKHRIQYLANQDIAALGQVCSLPRVDTQTIVIRMICTLHGERGAVFVDHRDHIIKPILRHILPRNLRPSLEHFTRVNMLGSRSRCLERKKTRSTADVQNGRFPIVRSDEVGNTL